MLNPDQMRLLNEIREKCYPAYTEFSRDMVDAYQQAINCIKTNEPEPLDPEIIDEETFQIIWQKFLCRVEESTKQTVLYIKSLPGFNQLDIDDLSALFDKHTLTLLRLKVTRSFIKGELFSMITENVRLTSGVMARLVGVSAQENIFKFHERFNSLCLNDREMSFLMPTLVTISENFQRIKVDVSGLKHPKQVTDLHELYFNALIDEFNSNNRSQEFINELVELITLESPFLGNFPK